MWALTSQFSVCGCSRSYRHFIYLHYRKIGSKWREKSAFTACCLFLFSHFLAWLAEASQRPEEWQSRLFYPHPQPSGMTSCLRYLATDIKLVIQSQLFFFYNRSVLWEQVIYSHLSTWLLQHSQIRKLASWALASAIPIRELVPEGRE